MTKKTVFKVATFTTTLFIVAGMLFLNPLTVLACGYGNSGGSDFVPQRKGPYVDNQAVAAIDQEQARNIVTNHISKLNPDLTVGGINDSGGFFEVEITNKAKEVVQIVGVDKYSGRLMLIN